MTGRSMRWSLAGVAFAAWAASCATNDVSIERRAPNAFEAGGNAGFGGVSGSGAGSASASGTGNGGTGGSGPTIDASTDVEQPQIDAGQFSRAALLRSLGTCALETYRTARDRAAELATVLDEPAVDLHGAIVATAWALAIDAWQQAEVMQFGPAATPPAPGGQDLRVQIYSWPNLNFCTVDEQIVKKGYEASTFASSSVTQRSLGALEYLLFHVPPTNACSATLPINRPDRWPALSAEEIDARRLAYARVAARDVHARTAALVSAWEGGFLTTFTSAGAGNPVFPTDQAALNAVNKAIFYIEKEAKDVKLGSLLGKSEFCTEPICPQLRESKFANRSKQHLRNNLIGFEKLFERCGPGFYGFADLLTASGAGALATSMNGDLDRARDALDAIEEADLAAALVADRASVDAFYGALRLVTTALKTDFVMLLDLELPEGSIGDND
jgi:uncharacterized protein